MLMIHSPYFSGVNMDLLGFCWWGEGRLWKRVEGMDLTQKGKGLIALFKDGCTQKMKKHEWTESAAYPRCLPHNRIILSPKSAIMNTMNSPTLSNHSQHHLPFTVSPYMPTLHLPIKTIHFLNISLFIITPLFA